ncbi:hypothetical protein A1O3_00536 [Capronia epimyces CBS 606.96]|uniref:FAD dependent oxidoreductase domain-containing protein n=1 Tax=Capronia epimyces CBS 606.96 TaxID=1182542 RepID=W9YRW3_9EURO|nr:uncharacterized protein A1O3_00536 [Capronia epimyces CBS 606.96]EXJ91986.1 hypothetical protein A1O3_00536 [Capronia epimyces CBS 606.96]
MNHDTNHNHNKMNHDTKILIVGAGAFGTSTAYHLAQRGYTSIRVLDRYAPPSCEAASTDISKVIRSDYNEPLYARLGVEAIEAWQTSELFQGLYHVPGWVLSAKQLSVPFVRGSVETSAALGVRGIEELTPDQVRRRFPMVTGTLDGWNINVWNPTAGWANSGEALNRMARAAQDKGVEFISGDAGFCRRLIMSSTNPKHAEEDGQREQLSQSRCTGVITHDGTTHLADVVVVAAGAWTPSLVDVQAQLTAKGHAVAHIQLSRAERQRYADMPILDNLELGYFFPPGADGVFKMAHSQFVTNTRRDPHSGIRTSIPHTFLAHPADDLPLEIEATMRTNLRRVLPDLADRPFSYTRLCWDADTADRHFLITPHPSHSGLFFATGGSAHGFKFMPVLGRYVVDMLEGSLAPDMADAWAWKPARRLGKNLAHLDPDTELADLSGWRGRRKRERYQAKI